MATIYYLNWDQEKEEHGEATDLFHRITVEDVLDEHEKPGTEYSKEEFNELYREITEIKTDSPEQAWREWNRGSGYETQEFLDEQTRSMSVGDVIQIDDVYYQAQSVGWKEINIVGDEL